MYNSKKRVDAARKHNAKVQDAIRKKLTKSYNPELTPIYDIKPERNTK